MKKTAALFKILLNSTYGISSFRYRASKNRREILKLAGLLTLIVLSLTPVLLGYVLYMAASYKALKAYGMQAAVITVGVVFSSSLVLFFGLFYVISTFYFSNDMEHLITLPLMPYQILGAKFGVVLVSEYITLVPVVLPPVIIYGAGEDAGILYWAYSLIGMLFIPVVPLCIASIIAVVVMRFTNIGKRRDLYRIIGGVAAIFVIMGVQFYIQRAAVSGDAEKIRSILFSKEGLINSVASTFPPAAWITRALVQYNSINGLVFLALFMATSVVFLMAFEYVGEKFFLGGYVGSSEVVAVRKHISEERLIKKTSARSRVAAIFWREFKILNRVPVFFINNVLPIVLVPFIFVMVYFLSESSEISALMEIAQSPDGMYMISLIAAGIAVFTSVANMTPSTSFSREGAQFFVSKYIPVPPREQIMGKALHSLALMSAGDLLACVTIGFIIRMPFAYILGGLLISVFASIGIIEIGLMIDLRKPLLAWDNPQKAVKQNINGVISMFINMLWTGIMLFAAGKFISNPVLGYLILSGGFLLVDFIMYKMLMLYAEKRYEDIEPY